MAALVADQLAIGKNCHWMELLADNAIGTTDFFRCPLHHQMPDPQRRTWSSISRRRVPHCSMSNRVS